MNYLGTKSSTNSNNYCSKGSKTNIIEIIWFWSIDKKDCEITCNNTIQSNDCRTTVWKGSVWSNIVWMCDDCAVLRSEETG